MAQAVRVFLANQRQGTQSALTRAEVSRTRKKLYKQKGTGGARHGDRKAPIFVGGGITFAPKPRDYGLKLPERMKRSAINSALTQRTKDGNLLVASGLRALSGKTSEIAEFLVKIDSTNPQLLLITDGYQENVWRACRNISNLTVLPASQVGVYDILKANKLVIMEEAVEKFSHTSEVKQEAAPVKEKTARPIATIKKPVTKKTSTKSKVTKKPAKKA